MTTEQVQQNALHRARYGKSWSNFPTIIAGFVAKGIPADQIEPRVNVLTYRAWQAVGRQVRKGEKGVKVSTFIPTEPSKRKIAAAIAAGKAPPAGGKMPWGTTVFHVSQTDPIGEQAGESGGFDGGDGIG